jgi:hypothetical protein
MAKPTIAITTTCRKKRRIVELTKKTHAWFRHSKKNKPRP